VAAPAGPPRPASDPRRSPARIKEAKGIILAGFRKALGSGLPPAGTGILVDEQFGADIARAARELEAVLAMPVEMSGQAEFDFEYGDQSGDHISAFAPTHVKVLVRYNPGGDAGLNTRPAARLARLGNWLHSNDRKFLFELLVPPERDQRKRLGGDTDRYDREVRPDLMIQAIRELQNAGVEPDVWKIEGLDSREDCVPVAEVARSGGRDAVHCVVLVRGGDESKVVHWLRSDAGVPGFVGFAVGRTIWWRPVEKWLAGTSADDAAETIAADYLRLVDAYAGAEQARA
jgi:myo-inositol catabolism protein IolC